MRTAKALYTKYKFLLLSIIVSIFAILDLFNYGIPPTHDGEYHVLRFWQFYKVLASGFLYPRWAPDFNNGFGVPLFNYVYPLPNYIASLFHFLGFGFIDSLKLNMVSATIIGGIFFYLWTKKYWGELGGALSSVFYTFSPYHFVDIYVRGSVGEVWALAIFPILLWSYDGFIATKKRTYLAFSCVSLGLLILAHNILALMFFCFFILYSAIGFKNKSDLLAFAIIVLVGLGLASPFWLPALLETKYVQGLAIFDISAGFTAVHKFFVPTWGFGISPNDPLNPMSVQIGYANLFAIFVSAISLIFKKLGKLSIFFLLSFFAVFFLMTPYSIFLWKHIPLFSYFQFPWRLLSLEILICSYLAGGVVSNIKVENKKMKFVLIIGLFSLPLLLGIRYRKAFVYYPRNDSHYLSRSNFTDGTNSPGNAFNTKWLDKVPPKAKSRISITGGSVTLKNLKITPLSYNLETSSSLSSTLRINAAYFPGWEGSLDGHKVSLVNKKGLISLDIPEGNHKVRVFLGSTNIQKISYVYFLLSLLFLALITRRTIGIIKK